MNAEIIQITFTYTILGVFVFTAIVTCLSLIGIIKFANPNQQKALFTALILEVAIGAVSFFNNSLMLDPNKVRIEIAKKQSIATAIGEYPSNVVDFNIDSSAFRTVEAFKSAYVVSDSSIRALAVQFPDSPGWKETVMVMPIAYVQLTIAVKKELDEIKQKAIDDEEREKLKKEIMSQLNKTGSGSAK